jgi:dGTPase
LRWGTISGIRRSATPAKRVIDGLVPGGFSHYEQSLRIVDVLENGRQGLNLTWEVRDGIARHSKGKHGLPVGAPP